MSDSLKKDVLKADANASNNHSQGNSNIKLSNPGVSQYTRNSIFSNPQTLNEGVISTKNDESTKDD